MTVTADDGDGYPSMEELLAQEAAVQGRVLAAVTVGLRQGHATVVGAACDSGLLDEVPKILLELWDLSEIDAATLAAVLPEVWIVNPSPVSSIGKREWLRLFKAAGYYHYLYREVALEYAQELEPTKYPLVRALDRPEGPLTVWRGASIEDAGRGMSWSVHRACALDFAERILAPVSGLYMAEVPGRAILAVFGDEREQEVVVNPNMLRGRVTLAQTVETGFEPRRFTFRTPP